MWRTSAQETDMPNLKTTTITDPATNAAVTVAIIDGFSGVIITTTGASNAQTLQDPTNTTGTRRFSVINDDTSTHAITVNGSSLAAWEVRYFVWDWSSWTSEASWSSWTVTSVSVVSANWLAGTVANSTTTPAITLSTSITWVLKWDGTAISQATAGTDYSTPSSTDTLTNKTFDVNGTWNSISNIDLSSDVIGNLPVSNLDSGTSASSSTFWRWDWTWASPPGGWWASEEFSVYLWSQYNFTTTSTILPFDTESFDTWTNFDTWTYKYTAPSAGKYRFDIWYVINWGTSWDNMTARVYKNAGIVRRWNSSIGGANDQIAVSFIIDLATSDTIHVQARNATSARASIPTAVDQAWFSWYKII